MGMPAHPTATPDGCAFDFPQQGHVNYVTRAGNLRGKSRIVLHYRIDGDGLRPKCCPDLPSALTLYFQRRGDDWSGNGQYETYRWWATFSTHTPITPGEHELIAPLDANWTAVSTSSATSNPQAFQEAKDNADTVGFTFGGGDGYGHGVYATGPARFTILDYRVE